MEIKFQTDEAFKTGYTLLHGHNFIFDTYKSEKVMKFFYPEMLKKSKLMLESRDIIETRDYIIV